MSWRSLFLEQAEENVPLQGRARKSTSTQVSLHCGLPFDLAKVRRKNVESRTLPYCPLHMPEGKCRCVSYTLAQTDQMNCT